MSQVFCPTEQQLAELYTQVSTSMSAKRFRHTVAVADMVGRLAEIYCPDDKNMLAAAALLHDITKEWRNDTHEAYLLSHGESVTPTEKLAPKTYHARTATLMIPEQYQAFAHPHLLSCVRYHTTGRENMTLQEKLVYLADYIDDTRQFDDCVALRSAFWEAHPENMSMDASLHHLDRIMILSFDMTIRGLVEEGVPVHPDTMLARNDLIVKLRY